MCGLERIHTAMTPLKEQLILTELGLQVHYHSDAQHFNQHVLPLLKYATNEYSLIPSIYAMLGNEFAAFFPTDGKLLSPLFLLFALLTLQND